MECDSCSIDQKLFYCCMNHPLTEESVKLKIDGIAAEACPNLTASGRCGIYEKRPQVCRSFDCGPYLIEGRIDELIVSK
jgi:Fe-S-cluster containining protein